MTTHFNPGCCCNKCKPQLIASYIVSGQGTWYLDEYRGDGVAKSGFYWRLRNNYMGYVPLQKGCVDENGKLLGLPSSISSDSYKYTWCFYLETGCPTEDGKKILWANNEKTPLFDCPQEKT